MERSAGPVGWIARGLAAAFASWAVTAMMATACAAEAEGVPSPRDLLRVERVQAEAQYAERERACRARVAVSGCLQAAGAARRETLTRLRRQEIDLDEAERRGRTAARGARLDARAAAASSAAAPAQDAEAANSVPRRGRTAASAPGDAAPAVVNAMSSHRTAQPTRPPQAPTPPRAPRPIADRSAQEARARAAFERKQQQAAEHREAVERRNAELAKSAKPAVAPLGLPAALPR